MVVGIDGLIKGGAGVRKIGEPLFRVSIQSDF